MKYRLRRYESGTMCRMALAYTPELPNSHLLISFELLEVPESCFQNPKRKAPQDSRSARIIYPLSRSSPQGRRRMAAIYSRSSRCERRPRRSCVAGPVVHHILPTAGYRLRRKAQISSTPMAWISSGAAGYRSLFCPARLRPHCLGKQSPRTETA